MDEDKIIEKIVSWLTEQDLPYYLHGSGRLQSVLLCLTAVILASGLFVICIGAAVSLQKWSG